MASSDYVPNPGSSLESGGDFNAYTCNGRMEGSIQQNSQICQITPQLMLKGQACTFEPSEEFCTTKASKNADDGELLRKVALSTSHQPLLFRG